MVSAAQKNKSVASSNSAEGTQKRWQQEIYFFNITSLSWM